MPAYVPTEKMRFGKLVMLGASVTECVPREAMRFGKLVTLGTKLVLRGASGPAQIPSEAMCSGELGMHGASGREGIPREEIGLGPSEISCSHHRPLAVHAGTSILSFLLLAVLAVIGTERLGRPLTDDEKRRLGALLREHDYPGARLIAMRFAYTLTRNAARAQDLVGRVDLRLLKYGWDPGEIALDKCLCRLVWSEWTRSGSASARVRRGEQGFQRELEISEGTAIPSIERRVVDAETDESVRTKGAAQIEKLRAVFEAQNDEVNLIWLKRSLEGQSDLGKLAAESGRDVTEFYAAAKRRGRAVQRLLASDRSVDSTEDPS
jgi:hypothetical protein